MCLCRQILKAFPYDKIWINFISELNGGEKMKTFDLNFYSCTNNPSRSIYSSPLRSCFVPRRGNKPNFWHTHWIRTQLISSGVIFCCNATVLKFLKLLFFVYLMELMVMDLIFLNSYIFKFLGGVTSYENCSVLWLLLVPVWRATNFSGPKYSHRKKDIRL